MVVPHRATLPPPGKRSVNAPLRFGAASPQPPPFRRILPCATGARHMAEKKGNGSATAQKANAKAAKEGEKNPRKSSAAQAELGKKGGKSKK
jgi:hypothetical protein